MISTAWTSGALLLSASVTSAVFNPTGNTNLVAYWGQNSYGATHTSDTANWQTNLAHYCQDDVVDVFPLAFLDVFFGTGDLPEINFANTCNDVDDAVFPGSELANCQFMATDIQTCQAAGKIITLSMGGATGAATFTSESQAEDFADLIWDLFLGGTSSTRPFGDAVLDGIDLDIEGGGTTNFAAFVTRIRTLAEGASKPYYITGAPQCPFPDANLDTVLNAVGFDAVYVQFYNNYCEVSNFDVAGDWDFSSWDNWAKTTSPNPNVKVYVGAPASSTAATNGYVDATTLDSILQTTKATYSSFGGAMLWDISQAYANGRFDQVVKAALLGGSSAPTTTVGSTTTKSTTTTSSVTSTTSVATNGDCAGVAAWVSSVAYVGGSQVTYNGHLWTANYWSEADVPGGASGDWADDGACTTDATLIPAVASSTVSAASITAHISSAPSAASSASVQTRPSAPSSATAATAPISSAISTASSASVKAQPSPSSSAAAAPASSALSASLASTVSAASASTQGKPQLSATATQAIAVSSFSDSAAVAQPSTALNVSNATSNSPTSNGTEASAVRRSRFFRF